MENKIPIAVALTAENEEGEIFKDVFIGTILNSFDIEPDLDKIQHFIKSKIDEDILISISNILSKETYTQISKNVEGCEFYLYIIYDFNFELNDIESEIMSAYNARQPRNRDVALACSSHVRRGEFLQ